MGKKKSLQAKILLGENIIGGIFIFFENIFGGHFHIPQFVL